MIRLIIVLCIVSLICGVFCIYCEQTKYRTQKLGKLYKIGVKCMLCCITGVLFLVVLNLKGE